MVQHTLLNLVAMVRAGDREAFEELLARFRPLIRSCGQGLPNSDRQDLEQELSIHLARLVQRYQFSGDQLRHPSDEKSQKREADRPRQPNHDITRK